MLRLVVLLGVVLLAGCDVIDDVGDFAIPIDLSATDGSAGDLGLNGCRSFIACLASCNFADPCVTACGADVTNHGFVLYQSLERCQNRECNTLPDGSSMYVCAGLPQSAECIACMNDSIKMPGTCTDATHCGACYGQYTMCESSRP